MAIETFPVVLEHIELITPKIRHLTFRRLDGNRFQYIPGQFISVHFELDGKPIRRSYSIATLTEGSDLIEFAISYVKGGPASELLFNIETKHELNFSGPYGRLILRDEPLKRCFLIGTGTGITPYRAMLPQIMQKLAENPDHEYFILLGVQHREDQLYPNDFLEFAAKNPRLHFRIYHSRDALADPKPHEHKGYVQTIFDELPPHPTDDVVYLCGNPNMIDDTYDLLKTLGFSAQQVRREKYVS